jgi:hypothetical protein
MSLSTAAISALSSLDLYGLASSYLANLSTYNYPNINISTGAGLASSSSGQNSYANNYQSFGVDYDSINVRKKFTIDGLDIGSTLACIMNRLCIIQDNPKHEQFAALKRAYDNYKMVEAMCMTSALSTRSV